MPCISLVAICQEGLDHQPRHASTRRHLRPQTAPPPALPRGSAGSPGAGGCRRLRSLPPACLRGPPGRPYRYYRNATDEVGAGLSLTNWSLAQQAAGALIAAIGRKKKKKQSGITAAKKRYTDKRKVKLGELRALKSKRIREHSARTKKLPKA